MSNWDDEQRSDVFSTDRSNVGRFKNTASRYNKVDDDDWGDSSNMNGFRPGGVGARTYENRPAYRKSDDENEWAGGVSRSNNNGRLNVGDNGGVGGRRDNGFRDGDGGVGRDNGFRDGGYERKNGRREGSDEKKDDNDNAGGGGGDDGESPQKPREFYIPPEPTDNEDEIFSSGISSGINFSNYDNIPVNISGDNVPKAITKFEQAELRDLVLNNVKKSGYKVPTPIQKTALPVINAGRDLMACAQTGSGKTAAFLLPIISKLLNDPKDLQIGKPQALVVSPTRELSIQIFNEARKYALGSFLKITLIYGGTSSKYQIESVSKGCHILICTPGRLLDFVNRAFIIFDELQFVVLDEADRMLDMGFKEDIDRIMNHTTMPPPTERQNLMFSATFPEEIQVLAGQYLTDYIFIAIGVIGGACSDVNQVIYEVAKFQKRTKLMELLKEGADGTIVFVETKRGADFLASLLSETEFPTTSIHGDRLQSQRETALSDFKSGRMKVLIATSVAARGLDIKNIKHVINFDMPSSIDEYVHRIGRTGRVGNNGRATSFFDPEYDSALGRDLVKILEGAGQEVPEFLGKYRSSSGFSHGGQFGGTDVRGGGFKSSYNMDANEPEESWD